MKFLKLPTLTVSLAVFLVTFIIVGYWNELNLFTLILMILNLLFALFFALNILFWIKNYFNKKLVEMDERVKQRIKIQKEKYITEKHKNAQVVKEV